MNWKTFFSGLFNIRSQPEKKYLMESMWVCPSMALICLRIVKKNNKRMDCLLRCTKKWWRKHGIQKMMLFTRDNHQKNGQKTFDEMKQQQLCIWFSNLVFDKKCIPNEAADLNKTTLAVRRFRLKQFLFCGVK